VKKISGTEMRVMISADIKISGDLAQVLAQDAAPGTQKSRAEAIVPAGRNC
jgi:hypothetical protein